MRHLKREVKVGNTALGGTNPVLVQSMLNVRSGDVEGNVKQAVELEKAGCQIVRVSVPTLEDVRLVEAIKNEISIPLVADIHFDYKVALACAEAGIDKIRINPGNIGDDEKVKAVVKACQSKNIPIRIGVNAGSLEKNILAKYGKPSPEALCESAMYHIGLLEKFDFNDIVVSIKSSNVENMINAYTLLDSKCNYPLHLGVTEAGTYRMGIIKSAMGIGSLLLNGIGDTIRVSLTDAPVKEIDAGFDILRAAGHKVNGPEIISCPTCGRTRLDVAAIANQVEAGLKGLNKNIKVAVMGCVVNGPGEAREADIGIACGADNAAMFKKGVKIKTYQGNFVEEFIKDIKICAEEL
ncbi:MAG: flavodoxin-dependent (E)-4-hydroxy-3-methylbut-2-enyl-diphosphate synthase [Oscillospiraceae bacterium]|nr:flavodoxin-dependent (E)-4-hydroxy-3-methylbut-2-enyl-diphosphate synthase [Oscillospiraceae bacterium]MBP1554383.1 flavodoxin-dependent (E)-4-hydroxy-3-methylbut-2-enyl-diphosphate synthase [Oscillospiraceae bacterium]MBQ7007158.1 flavodoxin-dependent (E)-4-hydroxy-3-methylbut-2-enyl-diphosphate synthase [Oscillospiraceae bacterium]